MKKVSTIFREHRLIAVGDFRQLGRDINDFHGHPDDLIGAVGAVVMIPAVALTKAGNALVGTFSDTEAVPLKESGLKYLKRDVGSIIDNTVNATKNLVTGHPVKALGNTVKAVLDFGDIAIVDPALDIGSGLFGHQRRASRYALRSAIGETNYVSKA